MLSVKPFLLDTVGLGCYNKIFVILNLVKNLTIAEQHCKSINAGCFVPQHDKLYCYPNSSSKTSSILPTVLTAIS